MKKIDVSEGRLEDRRLFLEYLANAGWNTQGWDELMDAGANIEPEAEAEYAGPVFNLRLEYHAKNGSMIFEMVQGNDDSLLRLQLHPKNKISPILERIIEVQDTIDQDNHPDLVKSLIPYCRPLLLETDEGFYQLS